MNRRLMQFLFAALALALFFGGLALMRSPGENWGATAAERRQALPGDEIVPDAARTSTMAITIDAPASAVWPWVAQLGAGRGGWYSYDWFENLVRCDIVDAAAVVPSLQDIQPGATVRLCAGSFGPPPWVVAAAEPGRALILGGRDTAGSAWTSTHQIVLQPVDAQTTRLFWRDRNTNLSAFDVALGPGFFVMQRGTLVGLKERAEGLILPWYTRKSELLFWLVAFSGFGVAVVATAVRCRWQLAFVASVVAALVTLTLVLAMPPISIDILGAAVVWAAVGWSFVSHWIWSGRSGTAMRRQTPPVAYV